MKMKRIVILTLFIIWTIFTTSSVKAYNGKSDSNSNEYDELAPTPNEEKQMCLETDLYDVPESTYISSNPLKLTRMSPVELESKYTLQDIIEENLVIRDQGTSPSCWAYAILSSLETNLALRDVFNNSPTIAYDFSEMHIEYATTREFLNGEINEKGYNIGPFKLGMFRRAISYLTNGFGAIDESDMPFKEYCKDCVTTTDDKIELNEILNKEVTAQVNDTIEFPTYDVTEDNMEKIEKLKVQLKNHIKTYGGVSAGMFYTNNTRHTYFNYDNSAFYCNDISKCPMNHAVTIIGWDDDFEVTNFGSYEVTEEERVRPKNKGAWIIKNSYGTGIVYTEDYLREIFCTVQSNVSACDQNNWYDNPSAISEEELSAFINRNKLIVNDDGTYTRKRGEKGFYYVSYEDVVIYKDLFGIVNASNKLTYDNIYQYNDLGWSHLKEFETENGSLYLGNIFNKKNTGKKEYLTQVSLLVPETNTVSVYVNSNGSVLDKESLKLVELKNGTSETFDAGYHTLEFLNPIEISGDEFAVVVEIQKKDSNNVSVRLEGYSEYVELEGYGSEYFKIPGIANGKCFYSTDMTKWNDFSDYVLDSNKANTNTNYIGADTTIKAFTISEIESIEIVTPSDKTNYIEGDDFDTSGMKVEAISSDGTRIEITNYVVENGSNLNSGQDSVTISYLGKTQTQKVVVEKNIVTEIKIKNSSTVTEYIEGQTFDSKGMVVIAFYKNGTSVEINNYKIEDGDNLIPSKKEVTVCYEEDGVIVRTVQNIVVKEKKLQSITVDDTNVRKSYIEGQKFDSSGLIVVANYEYIHKELTNEQYEIICPDNFKIGTNEITVRYEENNISKEVKINVEVIKKEIVGILIEHIPDKVEYIEGQNFNPKGMIIIAKYNDGEEKNVTEYVSIESGTNLAIGQKNVIIKYQDKEVSQLITVVKKQIQSIDIKEFPIKKIYIQNKEQLDLTGGTLIVNYNNGSNEIVNMDSNDVVVTGYDNTKIGINSIVVMYGGMSLEFSVEIKEEVVPINSDFDNVIANIKSIKAYYYTTNDKQNYVLMQMLISDILKSKVNDEIKYYYYLSSNQEELNINNWIEIEENQDINSDTLSFAINTNDISNYDEVSTADVLYLYIKEVASRENKQQTVISNGLLLETDVVIDKYLDDVRYDGDKDQDDDFNNPGTDGSVLVIIVMILGVISLSYTRYYYDKRRSV